MSPATDEVRLTIPGGSEFDRVAHLVLGGLAVRLGLTIENLEDVQLALDALLSRTEDAGDVTVTMLFADGALVTTIGPLSASVLDEVEHEADSSLGLRRVLDTTADDVHVDGADVRLTKQVGAGG